MSSTGSAGSLLYPAGLEPDRTTAFELGEDSVEVPTVRMGFKRGSQEMLVDTFGGKPVVLYGGEPMFAELALQRMCVDAGWQARWLSAYSQRKSGQPRKLFTTWHPKLRHAEQASEWFEEKSPVFELLNAIAEERGGRYAGCWDVIAWMDETVLFIESKRRGKDAIRQSQKDWLAAALRLGVTLDRFVFAEWAFVAD